MCTASGKILFQKGGETTVRKVWTGAVAGETRAFVHHTTEDWLCAYWGAP